jgi:hypothetical protein
MLEFEFNTPVETSTLVEFFARCGWSEEEAEPKLEWAMAASDRWILCRLDGEVIGFGRSCRLGPLNRVVFDVMVDSRFHGRGLRSEIVRLLSQGTGSMEEVSVYADRHPIPLQGVGANEDPQSDNLPWASPDTYLGKRNDSLGGGHE